MPKTTNKPELIAAIALNAGITKADAEKALNGFIKAVSDNTQSDGDAVTVKGFVKFERKTRAARAGRNPQTGEALQIAEKSVVTAKSFL